MPLAALLVALLLLAGAGYLAWARGLLGWPAALTPGERAPQPAVSAGPSEAAPPAAAGASAAPSSPDGPAGAAEAEVDPLDQLAGEDLAATPWLAESRDYLRALDAQLAPLDFPLHTPAALSEESFAALDRLKLAAEELAAKYRSFEQEAKADANTGAAPRIDALRQAYVRRMTALVSTIGLARAGDSEGTHPAYMAPDVLAAAVTDAGQADPAPIRQAWADALGRHEEGTRNAKYGGQLAELSKRYEALMALHREYAERFEASPPYSLKNGILGATAAELLKSYDELAARIEEQVTGMESYLSALSPDSLSKRMEAIIAESTELSQQDHLYCFTETYKIYAKDRELSNPAYERLKPHYEFAKAHWPGHRDQYVGVFTQYEAEWDQRWGTE